MNSGAIMGKLIKKQMPLYVEPEQYIALKKLHEKTQVPMQVYLREGVDLVLKKYSRKGSK